MSALVATYIANGGASAIYYNFGEYGYIWLVLQLPVNYKYQAKVLKKSYKKLILKIDQFHYFHFSKWPVSYWKYHLQTSVGKN